MEIKGYHLHTVDEKGRFSVPSEIRKSLPAEAGGTLVLLRGETNYILVYPKNEWDKEVNKLSQLNHNNPEVNDLKRYYFNFSWVQKIDKQSRILIPPYLLSHAEIKNEVLIVGNGDLLELWNPINHESGFQQFLPNIKSYRQKYLGG